MKKTMKKAALLFATALALIMSGCGAPIYQSIAIVQVSPVDKSVDTSFFTDQFAAFEAFIKTNSVPPSVSVSASHIKLSYLIEIKASGPDPEEVAATANAVAKTYMSQPNNEATIIMVDEAMVPIRPN